MPQWNELFEFIEDNILENNCKHKLRYTKEFCKMHEVDFKHVRACIDLVHGRCDCNVLIESDRFKNPHQDITEKPNLELGVFWTQLFGFLKREMHVIEDRRSLSGHVIKCKNSFKFTKKFCAFHNIDEKKILAILRKANAIACDCEVITNSRRHFEDNALIGTEPTINPDDMENPIYNPNYFNSDKLDAFKWMN